MEITVDESTAAPADAGACLRGMRFIPTVGMMNPILGYVPRTRYPRRLRC